MTERYPPLPFAVRIDGRYVPLRTMESDASYRRATQLLQYQRFVASRWPDDTANPILPELCRKTTQRVAQILDEPVFWLRRMGGSTACALWNFSTPSLIAHRYVLEFPIAQQYLENAWLFVVRVEGDGEYGSWSERNYQHDSRYDQIRTYHPALATPQPLTAAAIDEKRQSKLFADYITGLALGVYV